MRTFRPRRTHRRMPPPLLDDQMFGQVIQQQTAEETADLDLPHVVCVADPQLDRMQIFGPFSSPVAATVFAAQFVLDLDDDQPGTGVSVTVSPLHAAS